jgi:glyoxylase-like metal-dependent hydrolase (beta-lactamase superfamily II)
MHTPIIAASILLAAVMPMVANAGESPGRTARPPAPAAAPAPELGLIPVQGNVYMVTGLDVNVTVQVGEEGVLLVDTPPPAQVEKLVELVQPLTRRPIRYVINTQADAAHIGGGETIFTRGTSPAVLANLRRMGIAAGGAGGGFTGEGITMLGHENVLNRITDRSQPPIPGATVTAEYFLPSKDFFMNGDAIVVHHAPNAHSDGDSFVYFRRADVISTGDLFTPGRYPDIDLKRGGSIQGLINAVNHIIDITVPAAYQERGTYVIPGHGRLCDEADVVEFREMITIVRDRVRDLIGQDKTLAEVQAARPTFDYDTTYGGPRGGPTAAQFVEAVYQSLRNPPAEAAE